MIILAVDPGGTTGFCSLAVEEGRELVGVPYAHQMKPYEFQHYADEMAQLHREDLQVVCERFTISQRTIKASRGGSHDAIETIGVLRYVSQRYCGRDLLMQQPADVMRLFTDATLKALGWYQKGLPHANDALRHMAWYLAQNHHLRVPT